MFTLATFILTAAAYADEAEETEFPAELPGRETEWEAHQARTQAEADAAAVEAAALEAAPATAPATALPAEPTTSTDGRLERIQPDRPLPKVGFTHGFRIGYGFVKLDGTDEDPLQSSHLFTVGYEVQQRIIGGGWLNVLMVENIMVSGINQSKFIPTANLLLGFEFKDQLQVGAGMNLSPFSATEDIVHMVMGVGYTPQVGSFNVPVHASFIPDVDGNWRAQLTTGVNW